MPEVASVRAECYASFSYSAIDYRVATRALTRGGNIYDPVLIESLPLTTAFADNGILQERRFSLEIADGPGGIYRTLVQNQTLDGTPITIEVVTTITYADNTTAEQAFTQVLTICGSSLKPGRVVLTVVDLEDKRLNAPYPLALYSADEYPKADPEGIGKPIPFPVGTALKVPGRLLAQQIAWDGTKKVAEWIYALCELEWQSYPITSVNTGTKVFGVSGDITAQLNVGDVLWVFDPVTRTNVTNVGKYTVAARSFSAGTTSITVVEAIGSATVTSSINIAPRVLSVYRDGRLVAATEYTVEVLDNAVPLIPTSISDFSTGATDWQTVTGGTGTASVAGSQGAITGDGGTTNFGQVRTFAGTAPGSNVRRHQYSCMRATIAGTGSCWMHLFTGGQPIPGNGALASPAAPARMFVRAAGGGSDFRVAFSTSGAGAAGTSLTIDDVQYEQPVKPLLMLRFYQEQRDPGGRLYAIEADIFGFRSRNAADEIKRLITAAGATPGAASFATAASYATTNVMLVDCPHGARGQRRFRSIIEDLLFVARGSIVRGPTGDYDIVQDKTGSVAATLNELAGDLIEVQGMDKPPRPSSRSISYRPSARDPADMQHTIARNVIGGTMGPEAPRVVEYVRDHETADRLMSYLSARSTYNAKLTARALLARPALGSVYTITSAPTYANAKDWFMWNERHDLAGITFDALEYNAAVHTYTPATFPADADPGYTPDYSQTQPLAPTAFKITAGAAVVANDGNTTARITCECVPPVVNWSELWFIARHNVTGEVSLVRGDYDATLNKVTGNVGNLRPGEVYQLVAQAYNGFGVQGLTQGTFDATAIGGGGAVTTFTTPGVTSLPADVGSLSAAQGMGRIINVSWPAVTASNVWGYVLERRIGAGSFVEVWRGQATDYRDTDVSIGTAYRYQVKARDTYSNVSANYQLSATVTPAGNIAGGTSGNDIGSSTVATANRAGVTTISASVSISANTGFGSSSISHSLGKTPIAVCSSTPNGLSVMTNSLTSTLVFYQYFPAVDLTTSSDVPNNPHSHAVTTAARSGTVAFDIW